MKVRRVPTKSKKTVENLTSNLGKLELRVGWFKGTKYDNGIPVAAVAAVNELGYPPKNIPSRPFMRQAIAKYKDTWKRLLQLSAKKIVNGESTEERELKIIGDKIAAHIKVSIAKGSFDSLKEATIRNRLRRYAKKKITPSLTKPLIDTGHMQATVTSEVVKK